MVVKELIELLQLERSTKKVYISGEQALVEMKKDSVVSQQWGVIFR